ncbi:MAG: LysR family transcriptional regulator [Gammaproteobacteria bacterium]|nr:LysR family transcriptional regulator [Rhodocyclaceae bacterium]MBU3909051.1 LysR family transcriptional regulator [Gammaproteobacteria bacterium]MBU3990368.1 LysR family transcriptional regulator [Gammaproteobacteria bacterium]MBU4003038.1 LysR family transcriptional regulator [Gammaproteobacteria bacterium]MBU4019883.1 LysR family transcriptional regulator [Gammaproteobacteria bacterium]
MKHVTLRQLKVFEALSRHLSFSRAAEELHLTQPAVSMQVKQIEEQAGLPLTEMVGKKVFLTAAGEEVARHARRIAQQLREAGEALDAMRGVRGGRLSIGAISTAKYFTPRLLMEFRRRKPGVELNLSVNNRETVVRQLADNEIDLAIMGKPPQEFTTVSEAFADHPLVIVAAADHPLAGRKQVTPAQLGEETFLIRESGSGTRATMERYFTDVGITPLHVIEMVGNETVKQAVMAGLGVAFISAHSVALECEVGRLVRLPVTGTPVIRRWYVVHRAEKALLPVAETFREFLLTDAPGLMADRPVGNQ